MSRLPRLCADNTAAASTRPRTTLYDRHPADLRHAAGARPQLVRFARSRLTVAGCGWRAPILVAALLCTAGSFACGSPTGDRAPVNQAFDLRVGASATTADGVTVAFSRVKSDNRCPLDATCISAGDAVVALTASHQAGDHADLELHTDPAGAAQTFRGYSIRLVGLAPYPQASRPTQPGDYVATLTLVAR